MARVSSLAKEGVIREKSPVRPKVENMTFYLETDEYDSMESMGNEHETQRDKLTSFSFEGALREARERYAERKPYTPAGLTEAFPRHPRLVCFI